MNWTSPRQALEQLGVDTSRPGFYDDPNFLAAERENPQLLELYAAFIHAQRFRSDYLDRARRVIRKAVTFLQARLGEEDQVGKCIDGSMVLMRFLERQTVWSYAAKGGLTVFFGEKTGLPTTYFAPIMLHSNPAKTGHVWLYAPPYVVADVSVRLQPYRRGEEEHLPPYVLAKKMKPCRFDACDLMEPEAREAFFRSNGRPPTLEDIEREEPGLLEAVRRLGAGEVQHGATRLRYVAMRKTTIIATCLVNSDMIRQLKEAEQSGRRVFHAEFPNSSRAEPRSRRQRSPRHYQQCRSSARS